MPKHEPCEDGHDFQVIGFARPVMAENFEADVGERYPYDNAFKHLCQLEWYLLGERIHEGW
jgi:hypothetical protein